MLKHIYIIVLIFIILIYFFVLYSGRIPPYDRTMGRVTVIAYAIDHYCQKNKKLPQDITELNSYGVTQTEYFDAWGNKFDFEVIEPNLVILRSLGKDGKVGGEGENKDTTVKYDSERRFIDREGIRFIIDVNSYLDINGTQVGIDTKEKTE